VRNFEVNNIGSVDSEVVRSC